MLVGHTLLTSDWASLERSWVAASDKHWIRNRTNGSLCKYRGGHKHTGQGPGGRKIANIHLCMQTLSGKHQSYSTSRATHCTSSMSRVHYSIDIGQMCSVWFNCNACNSVHCLMTDSMMREDCYAWSHRVWSLDKHALLYPKDGEMETGEVISSLWKPFIWR